VTVLNATEAAQDRDEAGGLNGIKSVISIIHHLQPHGYYDSQAARSEQLRNDRD
jgi:hypothetical protein